MSIWSRVKANDKEIQNGGIVTDWKNPLETLRGKWFEVPAGNTRINTTDLGCIPDHEFLDMWNKIKLEAISGSFFDVRGWYHNLYPDAFKNKKVMDVGSGFGIDGITFAQRGADVTFVDIVQSNLELLKRICNILRLTNVEFLYLKEFESLKQLPDDFDVIWCQGSMINLPFDIASAEVQLLLEHLPVGGRWIELAYPKERWIQEGEMPFDKWGEKTDGWAPWIEWYDLEKLRQRLDPAKFDVNLSFNFHNNDFNWFDLIRIQ